MGAIMSRRIVAACFSGCLFALAFSGAARAQEQSFHEFCASAADLQRIHHERAPNYADGNGDGVAEDYLMKRIRFKDTDLEEWCIHGGGYDGYYIAWKLDGQGKPFKFIAKCSWTRGRNAAVGRIIRINGILSSPLTITSTDPESGEYWEYTYYPEYGSLVVQKHDKNGQIIPPGSTFYPKQEPFSYNDLPPPLQR